MSSSINQASAPETQTRQTHFEPLKKESKVDTAIWLQTFSWVSSAPPSIAQQRKEPRWHALLVDPRSHGTNSKRLLINVWRASLITLSGPRPFRFRIAVAPTQHHNRCGCNRTCPCPRNASFLTKHWLPSSRFLVLALRTFSAGQVCHQRCNLRAATMDEN